MRYGERRHGGREGAICTIAAPSALPQHMRGRIVEVRRLYTRPQHRREGHATALLASITAEADADGTILMLHVEPVEGAPMDRQALATFYERHGFVAVQQEPLLMVRPHAGMVNG